MFSRRNGGFFLLPSPDLDNKTSDYKIIRADSRLDDRLDVVLDAKIAPYRAVVEEYMNKPVGKTAMAFGKDSDELLNFVADFIRDRGKELNRNVDFGLINKGGIRRGLPKGTVTQGQIQTMLPFNNKVVVLEILGKDIIDAFEVMAMSDGNGVSDEVRVLYSDQIINATVNGKPVDPEKTYTVATIDYLANGGDYFTSLKNGKWVAESPQIVYEDLLQMMTKGKYKGKKLKSQSVKRMTPFSE